MSEPRTMVDTAVNGRGAQHHPVVLENLDIRALAASRR